MHRMKFVTVLGVVCLGTLIACSSVGDHIPECRSTFAALYSEYRADVHPSLVEGAAPSAQPDPQRFLFAARMFDPDPDLVDCAARRGDQLALFLRGRALVERSEDASELIEGLRFLQIAAAPKSSTSQNNDCRDIDRSGYECSGGLPEAKHYLGVLFANCRSNLFRPEIARRLLSDAIAQGAEGAAASYNSLSVALANPAAANCSFVGFEQ